MTFIAILFTYKNFVTFVFFVVIIFLLSASAANKYLTEVFKQNTRILLSLTLYIDRIQHPDYSLF